MNIDKKAFGSLPDGREVFMYTLKNNNGMEVDVISYGAIITSVRVPDRNRVSGDVVLGFDSLEQYLGDHPYIGAMVGRVCNRIGRAQFQLDGNLISLTANEGKNQLHGGAQGFDRKLWSASPGQTPGESTGEVSILLGYESPDGEEGFPGTLKVEVEYSLNNLNELGISCRARTDKPTHVNLTNHSYFNLGTTGTIYNHELLIESDSVTELDAESIPTGRIIPVENTPYDFRVPAPVGERINEVPPGYDINYVLAMERRELTRVASLHDPGSGRTMEVLTTLPGIQLYTSNHIDRLQGKAGKVYEKHCAVCLETQYFPDSPNHSSFPSTLLMPGDHFDEVTVYRFSH